MAKKALCILAHVGLLALFFSCKQTVEVEKIVKETVTIEKGVTVEFSSGHNAGDVLWSDGSWSTKTEVASLTAFPDGKEPVGVLAFERGGSPYCVGLDINNSAMWASSSSQGYSKNITDLQGNVFGEGVIDGSKALENLKKAVTDYSETNYPAFYCAENFDTNGVQLNSTSLKGKWYIPSIYELGQVYISREDINSSLQKLNSINSEKCKISTLGDNWYWSSSWHASYDIIAWALWFASAYVNGNYKYLSNSVLVVQAFTY